MNYCGQETPENKGMLADACLSGDMGDVGCGKEWKTLKNNLREHSDHYYEPFSRFWSIDKVRFSLLKQQWRDETEFLSSVSQVCSHKAYQQIIGMGERAIPFILEDLMRRPSHWFWALKAISGADPVLPEQRGRIRQMVEAWRSWGARQGYLR